MSLAALLLLALSGESLPVSLDPGGPYLIVSSPRAAEEYREAIDVIRALRSTLTDTFAADLSADGNLFNDRAVVVFGLPPESPAPSAVEVVSATAGSAPIRNRLVAWGIEEDGGTRRLVVQVDFATTAHMQGPWRAPGAALTLRMRR